MQGWRAVLCCVVHRYLEMIKCGLYGTLPSTLGALTKLVYGVVFARRPSCAPVDCACGECLWYKSTWRVVFTGGVPLVDRYFNLANNPLSGSVPDSFTLLRLTYVRTCLLCTVHILSGRP